MTQALANVTQLGNIERVIAGGDISRLSPEERVQYYKRLCDMMGLNPLTKPFEYITLQGKLVLYATKGCAEQLRKIHKISVRITDRQTINDVYVVTVEASGPDGRVDGATGAVPIQGLKGLDLANAFLKCETKAKRRVTLSICGLNMLDETEVDDIPARQKGDPTLPSMGAAIAQANADAEEMARENGTDEGRGYRIPFGKYRLRSLEEVGPRDLAAYIEYLERARDKKGEPFSAVAREFIDMASAYIAAFENGEAS